MGTDGWRGRVGCSDRGQRPDRFGGRKRPALLRARRGRSRPIHPHGLRVRYTTVTVCDPLHLAIINGTERLPRSHGEPKLFYQRHDEFRLRPYGVENTFRPTSSMSAKVHPLVALNGTNGNVIFNVYPDTCGPSSIAVIPSLRPGGDVPVEPPPLSARLSRGDGRYGEHVLPSPSNDQGPPRGVRGFRGRRVRCQHGLAILLRGSRYAGGPPLRRADHRERERDTGRRGLRFALKKVISRCMVTLIHLLDRPVLRHVVQVALHRVLGLMRVTTPPCRHDDSEPVEGGTLTGGGIGLLDGALIAGGDTNDHADAAASGSHTSTRFAILALRSLMPS